MENFTEKPKLPLAEKYEKDYQQLREILKIIEELGLTPIQYSAESIQEQWGDSTGSTIPIANEGAQGIRITRWRKGGLTVSFTNGFEDPKDPKRVEITTKLLEKGFDVV